MASPQLEDGHTRIANKILEAIALVPMSARELKVVLAIIRRTYGWNTKTATITAYSIAELTGIDRTHASRTLKRLIDRKILIRDGDSIGLQKDHDQWEGATRTGGQTESGNRTGVRIASGANCTSKPGADRTVHGGAIRHTYKDTGKDRKTVAEADASKSLWTQYLRGLPPEGQDVVRQVAVAIAATRKSGRVAPSVLD